MAGRVKHALRSHKTLSKNYSEFRRFRARSLRAGSQRQTRKSIAERIASLFKRHQDR